MTLRDQIIDRMRPDLARTPRPDPTRAAHGGLRAQLDAPPGPPPQTPPPTPTESPRPQPAARVDPERIDEEEENFDFSLLTVADPDPV